MLVSEQKKQQSIRVGLPEKGFVRVPQILNAIPIGASTWWRWVASGKAPKAIKLGAKTTCWKVEDINNLIDSLGQDGEAV